MNNTETPEQLYQQAKAMLNIAQATYSESTEKEAVALLQQSAPQDHAASWIELGYCYENGIGVDYDEDEATGCYKKAADLGNEAAVFEYARRQYYDYYEYEASREYLEKIIGTEKDGKANYLMGLMYYNGYGVDPDYDLSFKYHQRAADLGNADALFELYVYYSQGIGCDIHSGIAFEWLAKSAETGHHRACYNMGWYYETGTNVGQDINLAFDYYVKASDAGNGKATAYVGVMYQKGMVKPVDTLDESGAWDEAKAREIAQEYYDKSEEQGFWQLEEFLDSLDVEI